MPKINKHLQILLFGIFILVIFISGQQRQDTTETNNNNEINNVLSEEIKSSANTNPFLVFICIINLFINILILYLGYKNKKEYKKNTDKICNRIKRLADNRIPIFQESHRKVNSNDFIVNHQELEILKNKIDNLKVAMNKNSKILVNRINNLYTSFDSKNENIKISNRLNGIKSCRQTNNQDLLDKWAIISLQVNPTKDFNNIRNVQKIFNEYSLGYIVHEILDNGLIVKIRLNQTVLVLPVIGFSISKSAAKYYKYNINKENEKIKGIQVLAQYPLKNPDEIQKGVLIL